jgi:hypothetical protein
MLAGSITASMDHDEVIIVAVVVVFFFSASTMI